MVALGGSWRRGGPAPGARDWSRWAAGARQAIGLTAAAPLAVQGMPGGPVLRAVEPAAFDATLTAVSSGAYSWTQAFPEPGGTWRMPPAGATGTHNAWEYNGIAAPVTGTAVVRMREVLPGEFRFRYLKRGAAPPCAATLRPTAYGCSFFSGSGQQLKVPGVVLTLRDSLGNIVPYSPGINTCTTDAVGDGCVWTVTQGAGYSIEATPPALSGGTAYEPTTVGFVAACGENQIPIYLTKKSGWACCLTCPTTVLPDALTLDDGLGTVALNYDPTITTPPLCGRSDGTYKVWTGRAVRPSLCESYIIDPYGNCVSQGTMPFGIDFYFYCEFSPFLVPADPIYGLGFGLRQLNCPPFTSNGQGFCHFSVSDGAFVPLCDSRKNSDSGVSCDPVLIPFSIALADDTMSCFTPFNVLGCVYPGNPQSMTVYA